MLRIQQGRQIIVGLRSEAVRIAPPSQAHAGEVVLSGIVEHVEYQGHESLVHLNTGSRPAVVPELEAPRPAPARTPPAAAAVRRPVSWRRRSGASRPSMRDPSGRSTSRTSRAAAAGAGTARTAPPISATGDLVVRTGPDIRVRRGDRVPLLVDLAHLYVFDHEGRRICPAPRECPVWTKGRSDGFRPRWARRDGPPGPGHARTSPPCFPEQRRPRHPRGPGAEK